MALAIGVAAAAGPAIGADGAIQARPDNTWSSPTVTVSTGEQVTFHNGGGYHDVTFEDGQFEQPSSPSISPWTVSRRFDAPGSYSFYCSIHGAPGGKGMAGVVVVTAPDTTAPTPPPPPAAFSARPLAGSFCLTRAKGCPRPGIRLRVHVSETTDVTGVLARRARGGGYRRVTSVALHAAAGRSTLRLDHAIAGTLDAGRYRLRLRALGRTVVVTFAVRTA